MDWNAAIEKNREALKRILAMLVAMAGLAGGAAFTSPLWGGRRSSDRRVGVIAGSTPPPDASRRPPRKGEVKLRPTLPRHLHRAVLRLLRPTEAAVRRLIIVAARGLVLAPPRERKPAPQTNPSRAVSAPSQNPRVPPLPLLDPLPRWGRVARPVARGVPRISVPGFSVPFPVRPKSPDDPVDAARLALRLEALTSALDDLPGQARRFARWRARRDAAVARDRNPDAAGALARQARRPGRARRLWPLRPGRPPGGPFMRSTRC
jgi:hypothetical protein